MNQQKTYLIQVLRFGDNLDLAIDELPPDFNPDTVYTRVHKKAFWYDTAKGEDSLDALKRSYIAQNIKLDKASSKIIQQDLFLKEARRQLQDAKVYEHGKRLGIYVNAKARKRLNG